jgi:hypothetical protein
MTQLVPPQVIASFALVTSLVAMVLRNVAHVITASTWNDPQIILLDRVYLVLQVNTILTKVAPICLTANVVLVVGPPIPRVLAFVRDVAQVSSPTHKVILSAVCVPLGVLVRMWQTLFVKPVPRGDL